MTSPINTMAPFQLPLGVTLRDDARFENYLDTSSPLACAMLKQAAQGQGEHFIYIWGALGVGCTHLLQSACHAAEPSKRTAIYLPLDELFDLGPGILEGIEQVDLVCIDNLQVIAGHRKWEEALFYLFNRIRAAHSTLLIGADRPPRRLEFLLPDLQSRMTWGVVHQIQPLEDEDKIQVLQQRSKARGMELSDEVARYLVHHASRSMADLFSILEKLDHASLVAKRKLTIPFIKQELGW